MTTVSPRRSLSLIGATGVGVGAIVGGGVLALAGVAFSMSGPGLRREQVDTARTPDAC